MIPIHASPPPNFVVGGITTHYVKITTGTAILAPISYTFCNWNDKKFKTTLKIQSASCYIKQQMVKDVFFWKQNKKHTPPVAAIPLPLSLKISITFVLFYVRQILTMVDIIFVLFYVRQVMTGVDIFVLFHIRQIMTTVDIFVLFYARQVMTTVYIIFFLLYIRQVMTMVGIFVLFYVRQVMTLVDSIFILFYVTWHGLKHKSCFTLIWSYIPEDSASTPPQFFTYTDIPNSWWP